MATDGPTPPDAPPPPASREQPDNQKDADLGNRRVESTASEATQPSQLRHFASGFAVATIIGAGVHGIPDMPAGSSDRGRTNDANHLVVQAPAATANDVRPGKGSGVEQVHAAAPQNALTGDGIEPGEPPDPNEVILELAEGLGERVIEEEDLREAAMSAEEGWEAEQDARKKAEVRPADESEVTSPTQVSADLLSSRVQGLDPDPRS